MPLSTTLEHLAVKWKFRTPLPKETPLEYKTALAAHVFEHDRIEAIEIMQGPWSKWERICDAY